MALTPYTRQEEWYQQMINASTGNYLPSISSQDAGKVMTVESDGSWGVENVPTELPSVTSADETKVLTVDSNGDWVAADAPSGLPSTTSASAGDVLSLNNNKEAVWATPSSGGGPLVVHATPSEDSITLDKTWKEIKDADAVSVIFDGAEENTRNFFFCSSVFDRAPIGGVDAEYVVKVHDLGDAQIMNFIASSESGYPSYTFE